MLQFARLSSVLAALALSASAFAAETSFDLKQPNMEPTLVSALSDTKCLFRLFRFQTETASFCVLVPNQNS